MSCLCKNQLAQMLDKMKNLPVAALAQALNPLMGPLNAVMLMAPKVSATLVAQNSLNANLAATANAMAAAQANFSASAVAKFEALGAVHSSLGLGVLNARGQARLTATIHSMNQVLPTLLNAIAQALAPLAAALEQLRAAIASLTSIQSMTGLNMLLPNQAFPLPPPPVATASATARAQTQVMVSAKASLNATANATAKAMMALRLQAAAMALGFPLPKGAASLQAAINLTAGLPPLQVPTTALQQVAAMIAALVETAVATGVNLLTPNAHMPLLQSLAVAQANLAATLQGTATVKATASAAASASASAIATATAAANANAVLDAAAKLNLSAIPNLQPIAATATLMANLNTLSGVAAFQSSRCSSCVLKF